MRGVTEIESVADSCYNMARHYKRKWEAKTIFPDNLKENVNIMYGLLEKAYDKMQEVLKTQEVTETDMLESRNYENRLNEMRNMLKRKNIEDVNNNEYSYQTGVFYMDLVSECEHMGDYIINVVESVKHKRF